MPHRFELEPYRSPANKHTCPACGKRRRFIRYIDNETGNYLRDDVGRCDREVECGYHYPPRQFFRDNPFEKPQLETSVTSPALRATPPKNRRGVKAAPLFLGELPDSFNRDEGLRGNKARLDDSHQQPSLIATEVYEQSLSGYDYNHFLTYLFSIADARAASRATRLYDIGTGDKWPGATIFWQQDADGSIRTGKVMLYDAETGKRVKKPYNHITWMHSHLKLKDYALRQCLFGEHLLNEPGEKSKPVALVESEKTAVIASAWMPQYLWMATGSLGNLNGRMCKPLQGRELFLFPDAGATNAWAKKAAEIKGMGRVTISRFLETHGVPGMDVADFFRC